MSRKVRIVAIMGAAKMLLALFCYVQFFRTDLFFYLFSGTISWVAGCLWIHQIPDIMAVEASERRRAEMNRVFQAGDPW